jgi:hypothetical protein
MLFCETLTLASGTETEVTISSGIADTRECSVRKYLWRCNYREIDGLTPMVFGRLPRFDLKTTMSLNWFSSQDSKGKNTRLLLSLKVFLSDYLRRSQRVEK